MSTKILKSKKRPIEMISVDGTKKNIDISIPQQMDELIKKVKIGLITALDEEYLAMEAMLKNKVQLNSNLGERLDIENYCIGEIPSKEVGTHFVVLVQSGKGITSAALRASSLLSKFDGVVKLIMTGIAAGLPHPEKSEGDIRLGDIVVSDQGGVTQYDFGKEFPNRFEIRDQPVRADKMLLEKVSQLTKNERKGRFPWIEHIRDFFKLLEKEEMILLGEWERPSKKEDPHSANKKGNMRKKKEKIIYDLLGGDGPLVFHGSIASANRVLENTEACEKLKKQLKNVVAVEMEGKGIAEVAWEANVGYLVIRGICDYGRDGKGDKWHDYAALVAAAYTKALIELIPAGKNKIEKRLQPEISLPYRRTDSERIKLVTTLHTNIVKSLMSVKNHEYMYTSYYDETAPSSTVTAIASVALFEAHGDASFLANQVVTNLVQHCLTEGKDAGAWPPQAGGLCHMIATAWSTFASLRIQPTNFRQLKQSINWIIDNIGSDGGWPMAAGGPTRVFPTAYVLNSLLEFAKLDRWQNDRINKTIEKGIKYLLHAKISKFSSCFVFWAQTPDDTTPCLATSSMCYHVIHKYLREVKSNERLDGELQASLGVVSAAISNEGLNSVNLDLELNGSLVRMKTWPSIHVTSPINYTYTYFTPLIAVTLIDYYNNCSNPDKSWKKACINIVDWLIDSQKETQDYGVAFETPNGRLGIWSTAQASIILGRVRREPNWLIT